MSETHRYSLRTATLLVVASMIGTGVFTTSGLLLESIPSPSAILAVWAAGGAIALAGALSYAELAAAVPESGGEYALLSRIYHPAVGFVAGVVSLVAGFAAPIAACAIAFAHYLDAIVPGLPHVPVAIAVVLGTSAVHAFDLRAGARTQDALTVLKIVLVLVFLVGGALRADLGGLLEPVPLARVLDPSFAVGLVLVYFAYTGWNAAAYIAGELDQPARTLPIALTLGTLAVTLLYVALNAVMLGAAPREALVGQIEIGAIAAAHLFGPVASRLLSAVIALGLLSTVGAFAVTGTRVYDAMGRDHRRLRMLSRRSGRGVPRVALGAQALLATALVSTATFDLLLGAVGFTLSVAAGLTVLGVVVERRRHPDRVLPYRVPLYPLTPAIFVAAMIWTVVQSLLYAQSIALLGVAILGIGTVGYFVLSDNSQRIR